MCISTPRMTPPALPPAAPQPARAQDPNVVKAGSEERRRAATSSGLSATDILQGAPLNEEALAGKKALLGR